MNKLIRFFLIFLCFVFLLIINGQPFQKHVIDNILAGARYLKVSDLGGYMKDDIIAVGFLEKLKFERYTIDLKVSLREIFPI